MKQKTIEQLMGKLDNVISHLESSQQTPPKLTGLPHSIGIINNDTKISDMNDNQIVLLHSMLHMFANNKSGKGLQNKSIESLHSEVVKRLKVHKHFDGLDKNV